MSKQEYMVLDNLPGEAHSYHKADAAWQRAASDLNVFGLDGWIYVGQISYDRTAVHVFRRDLVDV